LTGAKTVVKFTEERPDGSGRTFFKRDAEPMAPDRTPLPPAPLVAPSRVLRAFGDARFRTAGDRQALAFGPDGSLWSVEGSGLLWHWDAGTGRQLGWTYLSDLEMLWGFSGDGRFLASASDDLSVWEVASGSLLAALPQPSWVTAVAFRDPPSFLATGHDDGLV